MNVVTVIPIARGAFVEELTYYSASLLSPGDLVEIPLRGKRVRALVAGCESAVTHKAELKASRFSLKKIGKLLTSAYLSPAFLDAARTCADFYAAPLSLVLSVVLSSTVLDCGESLPALTQHQCGLREERYVVSDSDEERLSLYKKLIRETFVKRRSVLVILPTVKDVSAAALVLGRGINNSVRIVHGEQSTEELGKIIKEFANGTALLIVGTPTALALTGGSVETLIVDQENTSAYKALARPFIDMRRFAEFLCDASSVRFITGDSVLSAESMLRIESGALTPLVPVKTRAHTHGEVHLINMRNEERGAVKKKEKGRAIGEALGKLITETVKKAGHVALLGARRGVAPSTVCGDCGETVRCLRCGSPVVLHESAGRQNGESEYIYACHQCGALQEPPEGCQNCGSWKLVMLGIGTQKAREELKERFPRVPVFSLDSDSVKSRAVAEERVRQFYATRGSILLGTEMLIPYLQAPIELVGIISVDTLLVIPDFKISERLFVMLTRLRERAVEHFAIQTRNPDAPTIAYAARGQLVEFQRAELEARRALNYPPYATLIKISRQGKRDTIRTDMEKLTEELREWNPLLYAGPTGAMHILLKIAFPHWPDKRLAGIVKELSPRYAVDIDPSSIL